MMDTARGAAAPAAAQVPVEDFTMGGVTKNYYNDYRLYCTGEDRAQAARCGGHSWNILNNSDAHEIYYRDARSSDHYIDERGEATSAWFQRKRRLDLDGDGILDFCDSSNVEESIAAAPADTGKEEARSRARQTKQLYQACAPSDYAGYSSLRASSFSAAPPTPLRKAQLDWSHLERIGDPRADPRAAPRVLGRREWDARLGRSQAAGVQTVRVPPTARGSAPSSARGSLPASARASVFGPASAPQSARGPVVSNAPPWVAGTAGGGAATARDARGASTPASRSQLSGALPARAASTMMSFSGTRLEGTNGREISHWHIQRSDKLQRQDAYFAKPPPTMSSSSVKYDILTNARTQYSY